jgi:hypothetical protein
MERSEVIRWLLEGDVSIQYQTQRDLLKSEPEVLDRLRKRIATEGWGYEILNMESNKWSTPYCMPAEKYAKRLPVV